MFSNLLSLAALAAVANAEHWIFGGSRPIITERLDSIVNPGTLGTHVHSVVGASRFKNTYDPDDLVQSKCTTIPVQPDKSNYWAPTLYHRDQNTGVLTPITTGFNIYYLKRNGPKNQPVKAFPKGLRMVAGNPNRKTYNASNFEDQAVSYVCLDYNTNHGSDPDWAERPNFFDHNCPDGMRAQVFFPSCWDGVNLDSADHKSHMSYPIQNYNGGDCPDSHPVQLISLFYEMFTDTGDFDYHGPGTWVLANGDTTGYGHHGDFQNGWDIDLLQTAIDTCVNANGNVMDCPALAAVFDQAAADSCVIEGDIVDEDVGYTGNITVLPGCNPIWDGTGTKPACQNANAAAPGMVPAQEPLPAGWSVVGCIAEGTSGRALASASTKAADMTRAQCASFCAAKGFKLAGVEFNDECYCANAVGNGASESLISDTLCSTKCAGNANEMCGGAARLTLMSNNPDAAASASSASSVPSSTAQAASSAHASSSSLAVSSSSSAAATSASSASTKSSSASVSSTAAATTSNVLAVSSSAASTSAAVVPTGGAPAASGNWTAAGCVSDSGARALTGFSTASDSMTVATCTAACAAKGFDMAGLEYGRECYCGNSFSNGQGNALDAPSCSMACAGDKSATCGGSWALSLFVTGPASSILAALPTASNSTVAPAGWAAAGCRADNVGHQRTLTVDSFTSDAMTVAMCVAHCAVRGHTLAGVEYARECYCGDAFVNGGGALIADAKCDMPCAGDAGSVCGGPDALTVFSKSASTKKRAAHKARHFGRAHVHSDMF